MANDVTKGIPDRYMQAWEKYKREILNDAPPLTPAQEEGAKGLFLSGYAMGCTDTMAAMYGDKVRGVKGGQGRSARSLIGVGWAMFVMGMIGFAAAFGILLAKVSP